MFTHLDLKFTPLQTSLYSNTNKSTLKVKQKLLFSEKLQVFSVSSLRPGTEVTIMAVFTGTEVTIMAVFTGTEVTIMAVFTVFTGTEVTIMAVFTETEATIMAVFAQFGNERLYYARLRFVSWQEHLFPHCFGTFIIRSFSFNFVLSENNLKIISTQLPEKWQQKYKPRFELPESENSVRRLHNVQYRNQQYGRKRSQDFHMYHRTHKTGHIPDRKKNEAQNRS